MFAHLLSAPFPRNELKFRKNFGNKNSNEMLVYVDARTVMDRLDEVCSPGGWQDRYSHLPNGTVICEIGINFPGVGWIWKSDGAGQTNIEAEKGGVSDAFKRAAVKFGIGRSLYDFPKDGTIPDWYDRETHMGKDLDVEMLQKQLAALVAALKTGLTQNIKDALHKHTKREKGWIWRNLSDAQKTALSEQL